MTVETLKLLKEIELGLDCKHFLEQTALGQAIKAQAELDEYDALMTMASVDPTNVSEVTQAQIQVRVPSLALQWLMRIIAKGETAQAQLLQQEQRD